MPQTSSTKSGLSPQAKSRHPLFTLLSFLVIASTIFFVKKWAFFLPFDGAPPVYFASVLMVAFALVSGIFYPLIFKRNIQWGVLLKDSWPLFAYYAGAFVVFFLAITQLSTTVATRSHNSIWWVNYGVLLAAVPAAYFVGTLNRDVPKKWLSLFFFIVISAGFLIGLAELLNNFGIRNPVADLFNWINYTANSPYTAWKRSSGDIIRLIGFAYNPSFYGYFGVLGLAWAVSGKSHICLRAIAIIEALCIVYFSGSRAASLAAFLVLIVALWARRKDIMKSLRMWMQNPKKRLLALCAFLAAIVLLAGAFFLASRQSQLGLFTRFTTSLGFVEDYSQGNLRSMLNALLSGRGTLWMSGLRLIRKYPLGTGLTTTQILKQAVHNDFLSAWIQGGPLLLFAFLILIVWLFKLKTKKEFQLFPLCVALTSLVGSVFGNFYSSGFALPPFFFLLGVYGLSSVTATPRGKEEHKFGDAGGVDDVDSADDADDTDDMFDMEWTKYLIFGNILPIFWKSSKTMGYVSFCAFIRKIDVDIRTLPLCVGEKQLKTRFFFGRGIRIPFTKVFFNCYSVSFTCADMVDLPINNPVYFCLMTVNRNYKIPFVYDLLNWKRGLYRVSPLFLFQREGLTLYFRQTARNATCLTLRKTNRSDFPQERIKLALARLLAYLAPQKKRILLFEKELRGYSESAAVLFERLMDSGYGKVRYLIDPNCAQYNLVPKRYQNALISAYSFAHYYNFFAAKTFMGTEALQHAIELRCSFPAAQRKVFSVRNRFIFLQHGVMYMVSLSSRLRNYFSTTMKNYRTHRVVVSSQLEAQHFIDAAGYEPECLYVTGLPKYDTYQKNPHANKIIIMPTWREWEYNQARTEPEKTGYFRLVTSLYESVPERYKAQTQIVPHPLVLEAFQNSSLAPYIPEFSDYSALLSDCALLITDYSSVSYAAFYLGARVIFYWKEKDDCMKKYHASLMLNAHTAFGDVCYSRREVSESIMRNYQNEQSSSYLERYKTIVEFNDGKNSERLIKALAKDRLL